MLAAARRSLSPSHSHRPGAAAPQPATASSPQTETIKHLIYIQFDNTHYTRDHRGDFRPRADASPARLPDLERNAPDERPHDPHLAHGGRDPASLTGLYPDRNGQTVSNCTTTTRTTVSRHSRRRSSTGRRPWTAPTIRSRHDRRHGVDDSRALGAVHACRLRLRRRRYREPRAREQLDRAGRGHLQRVRRAFARGERAGRPPDDRLRGDRDPLGPERLQQVLGQPEREETTRFSTSPAGTPATRRSSGRSTSTRRSPAATPA